jgi:hypothetical protein
MQQHFARPTVDNGRGMSTAVTVPICRVCLKGIERRSADRVGLAAWKHVKGTATPRTWKVGVS